MTKKDKAQSERFIKKAREIGADESGEAFERALKKVIPPKRPTKLKNPGRASSD